MESSTRGAGSVGAQPDPVSGHQELKCSRCQYPLPAVCFAPRKGRKRGRAYYCYMCMRLVLKKNYYKNRIRRLQLEIHNFRKVMIAKRKLLLEKQEHYLDILAATEVNLKCCAS